MDGTGRFLWQKPPSWQQREWNAPTLDECGAETRLPHHAQLAGGPPHYLYLLGFAWISSTHSRIQKHRGLAPVRNCQSLKSWVFFPLNRPPKSSETQRLRPEASTATASRPKNAATPGRGQRVASAAGMTTSPMSCAAWELLGRRDQGATGSSSHMFQPLLPFA